MEATTSPAEASRGSQYVVLSSYRRAFDLERRVYHLNGLSLGPKGVSLRALTYGAALVAAFLLLATVPVIGWPLQQVPFVVGRVAVPIALTVVLTKVAVQGRRFHYTGLALLEDLIAPR